MAKQKCWSYNTGEAGKNWVRAYEKEPGGMLYLEWFEPVLDELDRPVMVTNRKTGEAQPRFRRKRLSLRTKDKATAVAKAEVWKDQYAAIMATAPDLSEEVTGPLTLGRLLTLYQKEVTPEKGEKAQYQDRAGSKRILAFFGAGAVVEKEMGRKRYMAYLKARREGQIKGYPHPVRDRAVEADVRFMHAVFNWAMVEQDDGTVLLQRNPWKGFPIPVEKNPRRPPLTQEIEEKLLEHCTQWRVRLALILCRETGRRISAVRQIEMDRLNLAESWVEWVPRFDKNRKGRRTPLTPRAVSAIKEALKHRGIGGRWLFPAPRNADRPAGLDYFVRSMERLKVRAGLDIPGLGYHSGKRSKVRDPEFRRLDPKIREALVDTRYETLKRVYDDVTFEDLEAAIG